MESREAVQLVALMRGTWSRLATDEVANQLWLDDLVKLDSRPALEAFRSLRDSEPRVPAWSLFLEAYNAQKRRFAPVAAIEAPDHRGPTDAEKAMVHELVARLKSELRSPRKSA